MKKNDQIGGSKKTQLALDPSLDITTVQALKERLARLLEAGAPVRLDGSRVERADTASLQLLAAFAQAVRDRGLPLSWRAPSAALTRTAALLGLSGTLNLPHGR